LCDYCEWAKKTKNNIKAFFESLSYDIGENLGPNELINYLMIKKNEINSTSISREINTMIDTLRKFSIVLEHRKAADNQREAYNLQRKNKEAIRQQILIEVDYKQKIIIGLSPRQINKEYYNQEVRTCLGKFKKCIIKLDPLKFEIFFIE